MQADTPAIPAALMRLRQGVAGVGRFRQALLLLVVAGTIFNGWTAFDAQSLLPSYAASTADATKSVERDASDDRFNVALARMAGRLETPDPAYVGFNEYDTIRQRADTDYNDNTRPRLVAIWEQAGKVEFGILVAGLILWLILPRAASTQP